MAFHRQSHAGVDSNAGIGGAIIASTLSKLTRRRLGLCSIANVAMFVCRNRFLRSKFGRGGFGRYECSFCDTGPHRQEFEGLATLRVGARRVIRGSHRTSASLGL